MENVKFKPFNSLAITWIIGMIVFFSLSAIFYFVPNLKEVTFMWGYLYNIFFVCGLTFFFNTIFTVVENYIKYKKNLNKEN